MTVVFAHQGGWDEILFVAVPLLVIAGLLRFAKFRVDRERAAQAGSPPPEPAPAEPTVDEAR